MDWVLHIHPATLTFKKKNAENLMASFLSPFKWVDSGQGDDVSDVFMRLFTTTNGNVLHR